MAERRVGTLVLLNRDDKPIGLLTDRDLVIRVLAQGKDPRQTRVDEVMTRSLTTVPEATAIEHALALMRTGGFRRLPVTGSDGTLAGLVSLDDILSLLAEEFYHAGTLVEKEMPSGTDATRLRGRAAG